MMKNEFQTPEYEIIKLNDTDIIATSASNADTPTLTYSSGNDTGDNSGGTTSSTNPWDNLNIFNK